MDASTQKQPEPVTIRAERNEDVKMNNVGDNSEPVSEEEEFMQSLEHKNDEERQKWDKEHPDLPQAQQDAPTLLRAALKKEDTQSEEEKKK